MSSAKTSTTMVGPFDINVTNGVVHVIDNVRSSRADLVVAGPASAKVAACARPGG